MVDNANNTPQTFEQWLETKNDLTPEQRQALIDRNSQANITFTPEGFDRYLEELRATKENASQNPSSQGITPEQYKEAIELSKGDLSKLSYEEISQIWGVVGQLDDKIAQMTKPEALQAKLKMADFAEQLMSKINPNQPWSMDVAPEVSEWLKISNDIQANNYSQEKKDRNARIGESLNKFYKQFDEEHGLSALSPEHAQILDANQRALDAVGKDMDPFAKNDKGEYQYGEFGIVDKFYDKLEIDNTDKKTDALDKETYKQNMAELAYNEAILELSMNPDFAKLNSEQQKELLAKVWASHMQAGMVSLIAAQMAENAAKESGDPKKIKDFENQAQTFIEKAVQGENNTFKVSNNAALATLSYRTSNVEAVSKRIGQKTGHKSLWSKIKEFDKKLTKKYPKAYPFFKNLGISAGIGLASGGVGLAALSAYKTGKAIRDSYKHYKEANTDGQYKSWFGYLKKNPKEAIGLAASVTGSVMSVAFVGMDGFTAADFGLGGQVYQNGLGNTWDMMKDTVSNAFTSPDSAKDQPWNERMSAWGDKFLAQVGRTAQDGHRMARMGVSLSSGVSSSAIDFIASFREKDPEKKKQLRKNAWKTLSGVVVGSMASLGFSSFLRANNEMHAQTPTQEWDANHNGVPDSIERPTETPQKDWTKTPWQEEQHQTPQTPDDKSGNNHIDNNHEGKETPSHEDKTSRSPSKDEKNPVEIDVPEDKNPVPETPINEDPLPSSYEPQTDNEKALLDELRRGHSLGSQDAALAENAAKDDFNHYKELINQGKYEEADKFLGERHQQFENSEHAASNQISDDDNRRVTRAKTEANQAYNNYKAALKDLQANPNSEEAQANFDKAAMEMAKADVDKTEAIIKQEIRSLQEEGIKSYNQLDRLKLQHQAFEQENGSLSSIDKQLKEMGYDPKNLPEDISKLPEDVQSLISNHSALSQYQTMEEQMQNKIDATNQEILGRKEALHDLHSRHEETAGNAVNQHVAGYESYEGSRLQDLNEKIAAERGNAATLDNQTSQETKTPSNSEEQNKESKLEEQKTEPKQAEQPEKKSEAKSRIEEAKQRLNDRFQHIEEIPPEERHSLGSGSYYITGDEDSYSMSSRNIFLTTGERSEISSQMLWTQKDGKYLANGVEIGLVGRDDIYRLKQNFVNGMAIDEKIYDDLKERAANGETLNQGEQNFIKIHDNNLNKYGLTRDADGKIVQNDELKKITQKYRSPTPTKGNEGR